MNNRENKLVNKLIATLIFYISLLLLNFNDLVYAWLGKTEVIIKFIISLPTWGVLLSLASAFLIEKEFRKLLLGKIGILYGSALFLYILIGWISGNEIYWMYKEWIIFIYPWVGMAMFFLLSKSYSPKFQLTAYAFF
ncbi:MAG: hypothetical protein ACK4YL_09935 [Microcystis sp.]|jgi:hypothetical protein|nr:MULTISPECIES: hypothetical protein [unclassified Microcystis]MCE2670774.1 hypothetical protein [Microcystis sp. 49638_E5]MCZ8053547.1 hypothetical protein [Microcystis sp. LE19-12.2C]MDJ0550959.1 hypothetical protein [Microcystis sp. M49637_WE12]MDJ0586582.1 hypothetical protein [Microcystis sp. M49636_WE2]